MGSKLLKGGYIGGYIGDYIGEYYRLIKGDASSLDSSSFDMWNVLGLAYIEGHAGDTVRRRNPQSEAPIVVREFTQSNSPPIVAQAMRKLLITGQEHILRFLIQAPFTLEAHEKSDPEPYEAGVFTNTPLGPKP